MGLVIPVSDYVVGYTAKLVYAMVYAGSTRAQGSCAVGELGHLVAMCVLHICM